MVSPLFRSVLASQTSVCSQTNGDIFSSGVTAVLEPSLGSSGVNSPARLVVESAFQTGMSFWPFRATEISPSFPARKPRIPAEFSWDD